LRRGRGVGELDEGEAPRPPRGPIHREKYFGHRTQLREQRLETPLCRVEAQVSNKDSCANCKLLS
jgi:hypothetical protein